MLVQNFMLSYLSMPQTTSTLCSFDVNIDNNCNSLQLSTNINKEFKKHTNMVKNKQIVP